MSFIVLNTLMAFCRGNGFAVGVIFAVVQGQELQ